MDIGFYDYSGGFMKLDCHMHINGAGLMWGWDHNDRIVDAADRLGIDQLCVSIPMMRGMPSMAQVRACNDAVLDAMERYAGRILGYCYVVPGYVESLAEIGRCLEAGMIGIKLYNQYKLWDPTVHPTIEKAIKDVTGQTPDLSTGGGTSDARFIKDFCPVAEFGLINATAHKVDENAAVDDIKNLSEIYVAVLEGYFKK
mgnify:CR=1 FL=1